MAASHDSARPVWQLVRLLVQQVWRRTNPIKWPNTLAEELAPVAHHLKGLVLNAGGGDRSVGALPHEAHVVNIELEPFPGVDVVADVAALPFRRASFDSVLTVAVLEHVAEPDAAMAEMSRSLKRSGHLVVSVPFLQPYHPVPADFQRYTRHGLRRLGERHGLCFMQDRATHGAGQVIGWLVWEVVNESGSRWLARLLWVPLHLWSRYTKPLPPHAENASAFLTVFRQEP